MRHQFLSLLFFFFFALSACSGGDKGDDTADGEDIKSTDQDAVLVVVDTSEGEFTLELDRNRAPGTVDNFLSYVDDGFYEGTTFHRIIKDFMIQGGGFDKNLEKKTAGLKTPIKNEADNKLSNERGTVSMARTSLINSATSQFFVNLANNTRLDHRGSSAREFGYAVFGKVVKGMEIIDSIAVLTVDCSSTPPILKCERPLKGMRDVPSTPVVINSITRKD